MSKLLYICVCVCVEVNIKRGFITLILEIIHQKEEEKLENQPVSLLFQVLGLLCRIMACGSMIH